MSKLCKHWGPNYFFQRLHVKGRVGCAGACLSGHVAPAKAKAADWPHQVATGKARYTFAVSTVLPKNDAGEHDFGPYTVSAAWKLLRSATTTLCFSYSLHLLSRRTDYTPWITKNQEAHCSVVPWMQEGHSHICYMECANAQAVSLSDSWDLASRLEACVNTDLLETGESVIKQCVGRDSLPHL